MKPSLPHRPIIGVDFSGAILAGEKIWVSRAIFDGEKLVFDFLERASNLPRGAAERSLALAALRDWISQQQNAACGFDFPFSLARESIDSASWRDWLLEFPARYPNSLSLKESLPDVRRRTDKAAKTPFSPLNLRLYRQTYYGIAEVLAPLAMSGCMVLPFDAPRENATWLLEICPASLLKALRLYFSYKGKSSAQRDNRARILEGLKPQIRFELPFELERRALEDTEGDALDAVLAALCIHRALQHPENLLAQNDTDRFEGRVFF